MQVQFPVHTWGLNSAIIKSLLIPLPWIQMQGVWCWWTHAKRYDKHSHQNQIQFHLTSETYILWRNKFSVHLQVFAWTLHLSAQKQSSMEMSLDPQTEGWYALSNPFKVFFYAQGNIVAAAERMKWYRGEMQVITTKLTYWCENGNPPSFLFRPKPTVMCFFPHVSISRQDSFRAVFMSAKNNWVLSEMYSHFILPLN